MEYNEKVLDNFKKEKREADIARGKLSEDEKEVVRKIYAEANMPTVLKNKEIKCGKGELDIRKLNEDNRDQMFYRAEMLSVSYLKKILDGQTDLMRLLCVLLMKMGVENITEAIEDTIDKLNKETKQ